MVTTPAGAIEVEKRRRMVNYIQQNLRIPLKKYGLLNLKVGFKLALTRSACLIAKL